MNVGDVERYCRCLLRQEQVGGSWENVPVVFSGRKVQCGFGFGSLLKSLGHLVLPFAKTVGRKIDTQALEVGKDVLVHERAPKEALKKRRRALISDVFNQTGSGLHTSRKRNKKTPLTKWISNKRMKRA